ncbi:MAG: hypothetical protein ACREFX_15525 [Opitutaceae bacterium]
MGYLKTIVTYDSPSEAEVDKTFLESHGFSVCLLNANTARNELGPAFWIRLQVNEEQFDAASRVLREANPQRFGSAQRVAEIDREVRRMTLVFLIAALAAGIVAYLLLPRPPPSEPGGLARDWRPAGAVLAGVLAGVASAAVLAKRRQP